MAADEQGTEAAAATVLVMKIVSLRDEPEPIEVRVDRPFSFLIHGLETGTVLFLATVLDPKA